MLHITAKHLIILQAEKEALKPVYDFLKEQKLGDIFIQPEEKEIERYIYESNKAIVLLPLVSKSPIKKIKPIVTTTLEKLIVDLYSDKKMFAAFQGSELAHIINTAYNRYAIDFTTLFHYAKRRKKDIELREFLINKTDISKNILNDWFENPFSRMDCWKEKEIQQRPYFNGKHDLGIVFIGAITV